jgi:splicing factor, arginine/serine-rich 4/5/6
MASVDNEPRIYIGDLSYDVTSNDIREAFKRFGTIQRVDIRKFKYGGFAFVVFTNHDSAHTAVKEMNKTKLWGQIISVEIARGTRRYVLCHLVYIIIHMLFSYDLAFRPKSTSGLYVVTVSNLNDKTSWQDLKDFGRGTGTSMNFNVLRSDVSTQHGKKTG